MNHFLGFLAVIFSSIFLAIYLKNSHQQAIEAKPVVRIFAPSSFIAQWGPGPWLRNEFEKSCECRVEFLDGADATILLQRLKSESRFGADVVLGVDQYDLEMAEKTVDWKSINIDEIQFVSEVKALAESKVFIPYDYGALSFVVRKSDLKEIPKKLDDFLSPQWSGKIAMEDPRTSSPGLQFLMWLIQIKGEDQAWEYLKKFNKQVKVYSASWSTAYGLFSKSQVQTVYSYVTSPLYHRIEEKNLDVVAIEMSEGHPIQVEYLGIPENCQQCDLAQKFVALVLSAAGQKIIMEKNYMLPVIEGVKQGTLFAEIPPYRLVPFQKPLNFLEREKILKKWSALRRME